MSNRITIQKLKNRRFQKTEDAILMTFCLFKGNLSIQKLIKTAQISHSTFYRHHHSIHEIVPSHEQFILQRYKKTIRKLTKSENCQLKIIFQRTLIFLIINQKDMQFLLQHGNPNFTETLILVLGPQLLASDKIKNQAMLQIYVKEISSLIENWQRSGFKKDEIPTVIEKIMYLTDTARIRLGPITT